MTEIHRDEAYIGEIHTHTSAQEVGANFCSFNPLFTSPLTIHSPQTGALLLSTHHALQTHHHMKTSITNVASVRARDITSFVRGRPDIHNKKSNKRGRLKTWV
jgi:hypothetical protein